MHCCPRHREVFPRKLHRAETTNVWPSESFSVYAIQPRDRQIKGAGHDMEEPDHLPGVIPQEGKCTHITS